MVTKLLSFKIVMEKINFAVGKKVMELSQQKFSSNTFSTFFYL